MSARLEASGGAAAAAASPAQGPLEAVGGEPRTAKLGPANHLRLLVILVPTISLLLFVLVLTGVLGSGMLDSSLSSAQLLTDSRPGYHDNGTVPSPGLENATPPWQDHADPTQAEDLRTASAPPSSSQAPPTPSHTTPPDWLTSVTSVSALRSTSSAAAAESGSCQPITEPQCHMLPYNQTWLSASVSVVKSSEVDMLLRFFSYLSRLSCYRHIMLFGCSLALPECVAAGHAHNRTVVLPCASFCEAAREGCEPVLQMFNATWPDFLRCSQFNDSTPPSAPPSSPPAAAGPAHSTCYTPRQMKGKASVCRGRDHFQCATGICIPQNLVCNGYNDCDDWSDETHCACPTGSFRCNTGRCLSERLRCDGYDDCGDLSDELNCVCDPVREHRCSDGRCVSTDWLCDGDHDCVDKSDELNCSCKSQGLLECRNGQCIPSAFRCDGEDDCKDGSDEEHCSREQTPSACLPGQPSCISTSCPWACGASSGACDPGSGSSCGEWAGSGPPSPPAGDGAPSAARCEPISLELCRNLPYNSTGSPNFLGHQSQRESSVSWEASLFPALVQTGCYQYLMFYACTLLVPKCDPVTALRVPPCRSLCRTSRSRCESVLSVVGLQWPEDSDCSQFPEDGGPLPCLLPEAGVDECSPSHFKCGSGRCVLAGKRCDGHLDCDDHSDEDNCGCAERALWECPGSKTCIKASMICDGFPDCPLLADEHNCSTCSDNQLACSNHQCVHRSLWCDGKTHCSDASDEWDCVVVSAHTGWVLTVLRSAAEYQVCADEWTAALSALTCAQLGRGGPASVATVADQPGVPGRRRWLHVHPEWRRRNGTALQARLEKRSHACHSGRRVSLRCSRPDCGERPALRGHRHRKRRILGGRVSRQGAWPWQCSLQTGSSGHVCGCVLIGRRWALTVAHCFEGRESADLWKVVFGLTNLDHPGPHSQTLGVRSIIVHPRYNRAVVDYDISVLQLDAEVDVTDFVRPVCLPEPGQVPTPDSYCYISGWGHMGNRMPFKLQEGPVRLMSMSQCQSYFDMKTITSRMLCAGYDAGTVDSCMGDSGGPLVCEDEGRWTLLGLTSWGSVCFSKVLGPGVYSNVTHFSPWIQQQIYTHTYLSD